MYFKVQCTQSPSSRSEPIFSSWLILPPFTLCVTLHAYSVAI
uniref:Uncharacterized protein n=1 Tax=Lepeophtheirus salmonis TaxID=72036 RepID=A0A0K2URV8_LEPSM